MLILRRGIENFAHKKGNVFQKPRVEKHSICSVAHDLEDIIKFSRISRILKSRIIQNEDYGLVRIMVMVESGFYCYGSGFQDFGFQDFQDSRYSV